MNIIKFQDRIHPTDEYFNEHLKGKYAYWVRMMFIVPFDIMTDEQYTEAEQVPMDALRGMVREGWYRIYDLIDYVDNKATNCANDVSGFRSYNTFTPDADVTLDELKVFRTWLAKSLLDFCDYTSDEKIMLDYYANGGVDDALKSLGSILPFASSKITNTKQCGCCSSSSLQNLYADQGVCDPVAIYITGIENLMVKTFSQIEYWSGRPKEFIGTFKRYIDNMLKVGLIPEDNTTNILADCNCGVSALSVNRGILDRLSSALGYIYECNISGHKNFIRDALYEWSSVLYNQMLWE